MNIAILGCGIVGGGVTRILMEMNDELAQRAQCPIHLKKIVELKPKAASEKNNIPLDLFCGGGRDLTAGEAGKFIDEIIHSDDIDLVVETIGGSNDFIFDTAIRICNAKKHLVTANKSLLALRGKEIFEAARKNNVSIGFEAAVCAAIPIIKTIKESFTGDSIDSVSGIMNGTSNYILSMMQNEKLGFAEALKLAQEGGYAEADPTLDINGFDASHKLILLAKLAFGIDIALEQLSPNGIENIKKEDIDFAEEIDCKIKLICYAMRDDNKIYATVKPMMVKNDNFLSGVNGATNAVRLVNKYSGRHILIGSGAGSLETASSIVADIVFIARYAEKMIHHVAQTNYDFIDAKHFVFPYLIIFKTIDIPGITGLVTTSIGNQHINIDTVSHNRHIKEYAVFSIATTPCTLKQIDDAVAEIKKNRPDILLGEPKVMPILY
ncbi:MAG TPA: homoserine dehydrogenase [Bacteroidales bacterium]|nr:homoserine dehydrogenase [Bacteroidales bacterium]